MSGGYLSGAHERMADELFGWNKMICYGERGFQHSKWAGDKNPLQDREISEITWDLLCVLYSFDYYQSGDTSEEQYMADVRHFKDRWLKPGRKATAKRLVDEECQRLRDELYKELGIGGADSEKDSSV